MKTHFVSFRKVLLQSRLHPFLVLSFLLVALTGCSPISYKSPNLLDIAPWAIVALVALLLALGLLRNRGTRLKKRAEKSIQEAHTATDLANQAKREFLSNVSHELRTPLNALMSVIYLAEESELSSFDAELLGQLKSATGKLKSIIDTILDFNSLQNGELELVNTPFNLDKLLDALSEKYAPKAYEKGLEAAFVAEANVPRKLVGDPERLSQALTHLTENAIKFTTEGEISVSVEMAEVGDESVTLSFAVRDTGIGMTEEELLSIFQPFTQIDGSATRRYGGLGMGLILSKQIVKKMGGEMLVESQPGEGSTFSFLLELGRVSKEHPTEESGMEALSETPEEDPDPPANSKEKFLDLEDLTPLFQELSKYLGEKDSLAMSILKDMRGKIPTPQFQPALKELQRLITLYEFEEAQESLTDLVEQVGIPQSDK